MNFLSMTNLSCMCDHKGCCGNKEQLRAADELAKAVKDMKRLAPERFKHDIILGNLYHAMAAYESARGKR